MDNDMILLVIFTAFAGFVMGSVSEGITYRAQAFERGYMQYCPPYDGAWAWKGECGK
jgi:hypothetical protein